MAAKVTEGLEEKKEAIKKALEGFVALEEELCKRGAKQFKYLHPNVGSQDPASHDAHIIATSRSRKLSTRPSSSMSANWRIFCERSI